MTWVSGGTVINGTRSSNAAPAAGDVYGTILLLDDPVIDEETSTASGTVTYTYDVNYQGILSDPQSKFTFEWSANAAPGIITAVKDLRDDASQPVEVTYVGPTGMKADSPFRGVNIVVTRYANGKVETNKAIF